MRNYLIAVTCSVLLFTGCRQPVENQVAMFDKGSLTIEDLQAHATQLSRKKDFMSGKQELTPDYVFDHALNMEMIIAEGLKKNLHLDPVIRQEIHGFMSNLFLKHLKNELVTEIRSEDITDEELRAHYEEFKDVYKSPDRFDFLYAAFDSRDAAEKAIAEGWQEEGGKPCFKGTDDQGRKKSVAEDAMGKARNESLKRLGPGSVSSIVEDSGKFWIMKLEGFTAGVPHDFEKRKEYIRNDVLFAKYRKAWEAVYARLKTEHKVKVNSQVLEKYKKDFEDSRKKTPPSADPDTNIPDRKADPEKPA